MPKDPRKIMVTENEFIAMFHGWRKSLSVKGNFSKTPSWSFPEWKKAAYTSDNFGYHKSWDWLMAAWCKFRDLKISAPNEIDHQNFKELIAHAICFGNIDLGFRELIKGIKWYYLS